MLVHRALATSHLMCVTCCSVCIPQSGPGMTRRLNQYPWRGQTCYYPNPILRIVPLFDCLIHIISRADHCNLRTEAVDMSLREVVIIMKAIKSSSLDAYIHESYSEVQPKTGVIKSSQKEYASSFIYWHNYIILPEVILMASTDVLNFWKQNVGLFLNMVTNL